MFGLNFYQGVDDCGSMINFIHPYPAVKPSNQLRQANTSGSVPAQMSYSIQEIDRETTLYKNPSLMESEESYPLTVKMDHNEIARRLLDKVG